MSRYVEKEAFIALLNERIYCLCGGETVKETKNIRDMLEVFPVADVKPVVRGEWISKGENAFEWCDYECSVCGQSPDYFVYGTEDWGCGELPNFCPNCGAEMRKEKDDE